MEKSYSVGYNDSLDIVFSRDLKSLTFKSTPEAYKFPLFEGSNLTALFIQYLEILSKKIGTLDSFEDNKGNEVKEITDSLILETFKVITHFDCEPPSKKRKLVFCKGLEESNYIFSTSIHRLDEIIENFDSLFLKLNIKEPTIQLQYINEKSPFRKTKFPFISSNNDKRIAPILPGSNPFYDEQFKKTIDSILKSLSTPSLSFLALVGVSGAGKTSTAFQLAKTHLVVYAEMSGPSKYYSDGSNQVLLEHRGKYLSPNRSSNILHSDLLTRLFLIEAAYRNGLISDTLSALYFQLGLYAYVSQYNQLFQFVLELDGNKATMCQDLIHYLSTDVFKKEFLFIRDEAQELCKKIYNIKDEKYNLFEYSCRLFTNIGFKQIAISTETGIILAPSFKISVAQHNLAVINYAFLDFPYYSSEDIYYKLSTFVNIEGIDKDILALSCNLFKGRAQYVYSLIEKLHEIEQLAELTKSDVFNRTYKLCLKKLSIS